MVELPPGAGFYVQIVLFLAFAAILRALILEPTQRLLEKRQSQTHGVLLEAENAREEIDQLRKDLERRLVEARRQGSIAGDQLRRDAEAAEQKLLDDARADAGRVLGDVRARIEAELIEARTHLRADANNLARNAATRILGRSVEAHL